MAAPAARIADVFQENEKFTDQVLLRIRLVAEQVQNVYLKDVQLRFGLTRADDIHRLTVLEQHSATRKPWSACVLPFVVGGDARMLGTELAEIVWNQRAMPIRPSDGDSLATWISHRDDRSPFALLIALFCRLVTTIAKRCSRSSNPSSHLDMVAIRLPRWCEK